MRGLSGAAFRRLHERRPGNRLDPAGAHPPAPEVSRCNPATGLDASGQSTTLLLGRHPVFRCAALGPRGPPVTARSWCSTPRPVGGRRGGRLQPRPWPSGLGTLGLMVAVTSWIAHRISGRIRKVQQQVARIAAGDFEGFDPGPRGDEVQDLASSINLMSNQLKQMQHTIRQSERTRLLAQLAAGLAHQLRNSLTGARMIDPAPRQAVSAPRRRRNAQCRASPTGDDRRARERPALTGPRRAPGARAVRAGPAARGCRSAGQSSCEHAKVQLTHSREAESASCDGRRGGPAGGRAEPDDERRRGGGRRRRGRAQGGRSKTAR